MFIYSFTPGSFIKLLLHPVPDAMPHIEETQVMVQIFRVLMSDGEGRTPGKQFLVNKESVPIEGFTQNC